MIHAPIPRQMGRGLMVSIHRFLPSGATGSPARAGRRPESQPGPASRLVKGELTRSRRSRRGRVNLSDRLPATSGQFHKNCHGFLRHIGANSGASSRGTIRYQSGSARDCPVLPSRTRAGAGRVRQNPNRVRRHVGRVRRRIGCGRRRRAGSAGAAEPAAARRTAPSRRAQRRARRPQLGAQGRRGARPDPARGAAGARRRRGREPRQVALPGDREPRDPHAAQRHPGHERTFCSTPRSRRSRRPIRRR